MSALVLDASALIAIDRGDRAMAARLKVAHRNGVDLLSNGAVLAQVWRDHSGRQAELARLLRAVEVRPVDRRLGQDAGALCGRTSTADAIDATLVAIAAAGDTILTSDPSDIRPLVAASGRRVLVVPC